MENVAGYKLLNKMITMNKQMDGQTVREGGQLGTDKPLTKFTMVTRLASGAGADVREAASLGCSKQTGSAITVDITACIYIANQTTSRILEQETGWDI